MKTSAPTNVVFTIATIIGAAALISQFVSTLPLIGGNEFLALTIAFILLWLGTVIKDF